MAETADAQPSKALPRRLLQRERQSSKRSDVQRRALVWQGVGTPWTVGPECPLAQCRRTRR